MILQALYDYYKRKATEPESRIALEGWEWKEIPFLVVIGTEGNFIKFEDTRQGEGKMKRAHTYLVPSLGEKKGNGIKSNTLWEKLEYFFGIQTNEGQNSDRLKSQHESFQIKINALKGESKVIQACKLFIEKNCIEEIKKDPLWNTVLDVNQSLLIALDSQGIVKPVTDYLDVQNAVNSNRHGTGVFGTCLITGENQEIVRLEAPIKGIKGASKMGSSIVAINNKISNGKNSGKTPAFASFLKQQGYNSPISTQASAGYTTALNNLLGKDSQNKFSMSDTTVVFWAQKQPEGYDFESEFSWYFRTSKDEPDRGVTAVKGLFEAFHSGRLPLDEGNHFFVLGLAPNVSRLSVRFWKVGTIRNFAEKIKQHFDDFMIVHDPKDYEHLGLYKILSSTALEDKMENVPPNLAGAVVESILDGSPYPITLMQQCVRRIRAEQKVTRARAAVLKAYLNRFNRFYNTGKKEVFMSLDLENKDIGYLLGRLFSILEKAQIQSAGGEGKLNSTIRDRFYGAFSSNPMTVMPILLKLKNHHIAKLESGKIYFEGLIGQVMDGIDAQKIPAHLMLEQQAHFAVGYYHQRQEFFKKK